MTLDPAPAIYDARGLDRVAGKPFAFPAAGAVAREQLPHCDDFILSAHPYDLAPTVAELRNKL